MLCTSITSHAPVNDGVYLERERMILSNCMLFASYAHTYNSNTSSHKHGGVIEERYDNKYKEKHAQRGYFNADDTEVSCSNINCSL
jgi:hypothetical protein